MVGQNKILVRVIPLFISNECEQEWKIKKKKKKKRELWNNLSPSTEYGSAENTSVVAESQTFQSTSSQQTGIYSDKFAIKISFKPLYLPHMLALFAPPKLLCISFLIFVFPAPHDTSNAIKQE